MSFASGENHLFALGSRDDFPDGLHDEFGPIKMDFVTAFFGYDQSARTGEPFQFGEVPSARFPVALLSPEDNEGEAAQ